MMNITLTPFTPERVDLTAEGFGPFPLEGRVESLLEKEPTDSAWAASGCDRALYLDLAERIVRPAIHWVDDSGAVIDPVTGSEWNQSTPRFVSSAAVLVAFGRCREHLDLVCLAMAYCCRRMRDGRARDMAPDFWLRDLMIADRCLEGIAPTDQQQAWREDLCAVNGEKLYKYVDPTHGKKLKRLHNWTIYAAAGEGLRELAGLGPSDRSWLWGKDFFDTYMRAQLHHLTDYGMYRDPDNPITYDITTRLQFCVPLAFGLPTPLHTTLNELQRRGSLTALLFTSPEGYAPYGGRSSQFQFQEAILSALFELEALRYRDYQPSLAGAFKSQARRCALATQRWILGMTPPRHLKNAWSPKSRHGIDGYGQYSVYSLLCASFYGLAALFADDSIPEYAPPSCRSGYVFSIKEDFHKIFATCGNTYVEIDTSADDHYDATGIGRLHFGGTPLEMVLPMSFSAHPKYQLAPQESAPSSPVALAPSWGNASETFSLAALSEPELKNNVTIHRQAPEAVAFTVDYEHTPSNSRIKETLVLSPNTLHIDTRATIGDTPAENLTYTVPVIITDGEEESEVHLDKGHLQVHYRGHQWEVLWDEHKAQATLLPATFSNRNGRYQRLDLDFGPEPATLTIRNCGVLNKEPKTSINI